MATPTGDDENADAREAFDGGQSIDDAVRCLRAERTGVLSFGEHFRPVKFVTDNETGHVVAPVPAAVFDAYDHVIFVPEEADDALQLLVTPEPIDGEIHAAADRWRIHHGEPEDVRWARFHIEGARYGPVVIDGEAFMVGNPLRGAEPGLCKRLNADKGLLTKVCAARAGVAVAEPLCVGVDPDGLHVRARFGVVRVPFETRVETAEEAGRAVDELLRESHG